VRKTYGIAEAPESVGPQALNSSSGSVNRMELDAEDNLHAGLVGFDVEAVADCAEVGNVDLDGVADFDKVVRGEAPHGIVGVGLDDDRKLDLALELVDLGRVLSLGDGVLVSGDVLDKEAVLGEDSHAFSSITKVVVAKVDSTSVERHARGEALVLDKVSMIHVKAGSGYLPASSGVGC
jgi:hypothetical protein